MSLFGKNLPKDSGLEPARGIAHGTVSGHEDGCTEPCCQPVVDDNKYVDGPQNKPTGKAW